MYVVRSRNLKRFNEDIKKQMMKLLRYSLILIIFLILSSCAAVQTEESSAKKITLQPAAQKVDNNKETVIDNSTAVSDKSIVYDDYHIKPGDQMEISVFGEPDMSKRIIVQPDGKLCYFLVGEIDVVGMTFSELRQEIEKMLSKYILSPSVTIIGEKYEGNYMTILGSVRKPGRHSVFQTDRVIDALSRAEGLRFASTDDSSFSGEISNLKMAYLSRDGKLMNVDFDKLINSGDMSQNISVQVGDFIYIPSSTTQKVFVLGEVNLSRSIPCSATTTLLEAITSAEGFNEKTACKRSVCVIKGSLVKPEVIILNFNKIVSGKEKNIVLDPGDIVYVPSTFVTDVERISAQIIPFLNSIIGADNALDIGQKRWKNFNPYRE